MADNSILEDVRSMLGVTGTEFDLDIRLWINSAFSTLNQIGVGPPDGFSVADENATWDQFLVSGPMLDMTKTYIYMKVKYAFDPPGTGYHTTAAAEIIKEHEIRLSYAREETEWVAPIPEVVLDEDLITEPLLPEF